MSNQSNPEREACCSLQSLLSPELFKSLGDPNRLQLVLQLAACGGTCTVGALAECLTIDVSVVSRHLSQLRRAGVVEANKQGKQVHYRLRFGEVARTLRAIADAIDACCPTGSSCCSVVEAPQYRSSSN